ncbi:MAG TPA: hypothetical protein VFN97_12925 [Actinospica sp.]|nr:hypothetical protein [Actinospica sp.]
MEIELVPEFGARLPGGALLFGAAEADARHLLECLGQPSKPFVCGTAWAWRVQIADRWVQAEAGGDGLLGVIRIMRAIEYAAGAAAGIPVTYRGVDVFEFTVAELEFLLGPGSRPDLRLTGVHGYAEMATLTDLSRPATRGR